MHTLAALCRFCGDVAPPTINTNSNRLRVTFVSDNSVGALGFTAHYRAIVPSDSECGPPTHTTTPTPGASPSQGSRGPLMQGHPEPWAPVGSFQGRGRLCYTADQSGPFWPSDL